MRTRHRPGVSIPTDNGAEIEALAGSNPSFAAGEQNEPYTIALSTLVATWRPGRLELYVDGWSRPSSTAAATNPSALFGIYRWGWGSRRRRTSTATSR